MTFAGCVELTPAGELASVHWFKRLDSVVRVGSAGSLTISAPGQHPIAPLHSPPPAPTAVQAWSAKASKNPDVADVLAHMGRADNWYDLYKAIEVCEEIAGDERKLAGFAGVNKTRLKMIRTTANHYRHARTYKPPNAPTFAEAHAFVCEVVRNTLAKAPASPERTFD